MTGKPPLDERQQTLLRQAKNCRDLAHFLRTDLRVEGHFWMGWWFTDGHDTASTRLFDLRKCHTSACAMGWAMEIGLIPVTNLDEYTNPNGEWFGCENTITWHTLFGTADRTPQEEALVLEEHATELEGQV